MPETMEQKPPGTKVKDRREIYRDVLHLLKLEVQKHKKMLELVRSLAREEAKRAGKLVNVIDAVTGFFEFLPWVVTTASSNRETKVRHIKQQDWVILENHLKAMEALLNCISFIEAQPVYEVNR